MSAKSRPALEAYVSQLNLLAMGTMPLDSHEPLAWECLLSGPAVHSGGGGGGLGLGGGGGDVGGGGGGGEGDWLAQLINTSSSGPHPCAAPSPHPSNWQCSSEASTPVHASPDIQVGTVGRGCSLLLTAKIGAKPCLISAMLIQDRPRLCPADRIGAADLYPSWRQATFASVSSNPLLQTEPHLLSWYTCRRPFPNQFEGSQFAEAEGSQFAVRIAPSSVGVDGGGGGGSGGRRTAGGGLGSGGAGFDDGGGEGDGGGGTGTPTAGTVSPE